jgi:hypothetical protein
MKRHSNVGENGELKYRELMKDEKRYIDVIRIRCRPNSTTEMELVEDSRKGQIIVRICYMLCWVT